MLITFLLSGNNDVIFRIDTFEFRVFMHAWQSIQKQIVEYDKKVDILENTRPSIKLDVKDF